MTNGRRGHRLIKRAIKYLKVEMGSLGELGTLSGAKGHLHIAPNMGWRRNEAFLAYHLPCMVPEQPDNTDALDGRFIAVADDDITWRFDRSFLESRWTCIWGRGCLGILPEAAPERQHGCCSVGAELDDEDEANLIAALADTLEPAHFQYWEEARDRSVFRDATHSATRVVDGACIFLNRVDFGGGAGCALHLAALDYGDSPVGMKPSVCWQLPLKVDWVAEGDHETATMRAWTRQDWGAEGETMAWCCTEGDRAYVGDEPVVDSMAEEITEIVGERVYVELRRRLQP